jgi:hypothetical protein
VKRCRSSQRTRPTVSLRPVDGFTIPRKVDEVVVGRIGRCAAVVDQLLPAHRSWVLNTSVPFAYQRLPPLPRMSIVDVPSPLSVTCRSRVLVVQAVLKVLPVAVFVHTLEPFALSR